jgi:uncharacterized RDD family membrane protein YckC
MIKTMRPNACAPATTGELAAPAGIVRRALAAVTDLPAVVATLYALEAGVAVSMIGAWPGSLDHCGAAVVRECAVSPVVAAAYSAECWSRSGRTAGAALLGVRVVGRDGLPLHPAEAVLRAVACMIVPVGLRSAAVDTQRRSLQDMVFGSRVIRERRRRLAPPLTA